MQKLCLNTPSDAQTKWLRRALSANRAPYLLLTTSLPQADELDNALEGASFQLVRRSGFMASDRVETPLKKKTQLPFRQVLSCKIVIKALCMMLVCRMCIRYTAIQANLYGGDIMIQQDHLQIFDLTLNVWAPLFVGNGSSYTKKEYM